jgi:hypothetical protein
MYSMKKYDPYNYGELSTQTFCKLAINLSCYELDITNGHDAVCACLKLKNNCHSI